MSRPIAIGVGCRAGCPAEVIEALVREALTRVPAAAPPGLFTIADKRGEAGITAAAARLGLDLVFLPRTALRDQAVLTHSPRSESRFGVPSVAEAAALAGAGLGATLLVPRIAKDGATCAIAGPVEPRP